MERAWYPGCCYYLHGPAEEQQRTDFRPYREPVQRRSSRFIQGTSDSLYSNIYKEYNNFTSLVNIAVHMCAYTYIIEVH